MYARGSLLTGLGAGLALGYLLDPDRGNRRRARLRDAAVHGARLTRDGLGATARDVGHRTYGTVASVRRAARRRRADDRVLVERVRALLGRYVSHPHAIDVDAHEGVVALRGPILKLEVDPLMRAVGRVSGVVDAINNLEQHETADSVPSLQGGVSRPGLRPDLFQRQWSPATRMLVGLAGAAVAGYGTWRGDKPGALLAVGGATLAAMAGTNAPLRQITGLTSRRRAVDIQKTIFINAPVDEVFRFWTMYENFPRFMSRVLDVRPSAREGQSHWTVAGPAGVPIEFDAEVTDLVPNRIFAWRSIEGSAVAHAGVVRFDPEDGGARVHIRMSYNPPGGWIGHGVAAAFGADPKRSMDADLARLKTLIETGRPPHDAAQPLH
jgi:uncharacterized membrane protein